MAVIGNPIGFLNSSAKPIIGTLANFWQANCLKQAKITTATQLVAGDPLVVLVSQANQSSNPIGGLNPFNQSITAKATTATGGANTTDCCGFLIVNSNDLVTTGGVGLPYQGQVCMYAPLGEGAVIWLEVASQNLAGFNTNLDANTAITIDGTNGGVKVSGGGADVLVGAKIVQGVVDCQKISVVGGTATLVDCKGIMVQLS